ncbi:Serine/threonine-protein kinase SCH9 [Nakaseomyces bracarensis]|uniref:Serine/threonine-protein kinase SCH9 n=1 Tax=Nakaseomyces bracarensis TaxID=273131 RepID=A0ABR4NTN6_9SACH
MNFFGSKQPNSQGSGGSNPNKHIHSAGNGFFPSFTSQTATPTTAVSANSYAMGTTGIASEDVISRMKAMNSDAAAKAQAQAQSQAQQAPADNGVVPNKIVIGVNDKPAIITTNYDDKNTQTARDGGDQGPVDYLSPSPVQLPSKSSNEDSSSQSSGENDIPRGKLEVTIIEARNLRTVSTESLPYVVCTFESSEFISDGPESVDNRGSYGGGGLPSIKEQLRKRPLYTHRSSSQLNNLASRQNTNDTSYGDGLNPIWHHKTTFDVLGSHSELDISVYDSVHEDMFLGQVRLRPNIHTVANMSQEQWYPLQSRVANENVSGEILIKWHYTSTMKKHYGPEDFEVLRLLGKGTFGQVYQVKKKDTKRIYAMKVLSKKVIVKKNEIAHTIGERNILVTTSAKASPFIVGLKFSFQTPTDLYLVTDYMSGGELFWHLQREGRFAEDRAKFYIAELVLALEHLHDNDIVYRDLKPENILLDANGNIALCDFGLSKADLKDRTNTFCGTTEYLAPELLLDESGYTKMVDFWSLGVLIFEMCCGWSPFYAEDNQKMYQKIAFGKVKFPRDILSPEGRSFVKGLLNRNPKHRLGSVDDGRELRAHPFFADIDWELLKQKKIPPPFKPHLNSETDTSNFDPEFTQTSTSYMNKHHQIAATPLSPGMQAKFAGFTFVDESAIDERFNTNNNNRKFLQSSSFMEPGSFIPGNPNLPPDEDVIEDHEEDEDFEVSKDMRGLDFDGDQHMDDEFVSGRFEI